MKILLTLLFCITSLAYGQNNIKGVVLDSTNSQPVPFTTVYINGTTKGTITNDEGMFEIKNVPNPSEVVFSHICYEPKYIEIKTGNTRYLKVLLNPKKINISEVVVKGDNLRKENINEFKKHFLGTDYWGLKAILENDDVLFFNNNGKFRKISELKAYTTAPLIVDLPKLGYKLHVDLVDFDVKNSTKGTRCSFLAFYYFQSYKSTNQSNAKKYELNRQEAYYNSSQQFCRCLYKQNLEQNGYKLYEKTINENTKENEYKLIYIKGFIKPIENNEMQILGLKNKEFIILYNSKIKKLSNNSFPINNYNYKKSIIYFLNDTCTIRKNGTIPDNSILFGGEISKHKVGSFLPDNYIPVSSERGD